MKARRWHQRAQAQADPTGALGAFQIFIDGGALRARLDGKRGTLMSRGLRGTFVRDANGKVEYFVTRVGVARRVP